MLSGEVLRTLPTNEESMLEKTDSYTHAICIENTDKVVELPPRPFSHPSEISICESNAFVQSLSVCDSEKSLGRPSSTPGTLNISCSEGTPLGIFLTSDAAKLSTVSQRISPSSSTMTLVSCDDQAVLKTEENNLSCIPGNLVPTELLRDTEPETEALIQDSLDNSNTKVLDIPSNAIDDINHPLNAELIRAATKRPHSVLSDYAFVDDNVDDNDETLLRPSSAPKRLVTYASPFVTNDMLGEFTSPTPVPRSDDCDNISDVGSAPRSTLEALVASNSPLQFFPFGYSADPDRQDMETTNNSVSVTMNQLSPVHNYIPEIETCNLTSEANMTAILTDAVHGDALNVHSTDSISSSKSMASVDLSEASTNTVRTTDIHDSPTSNLSDLSAMHDSGLDDATSATKEKLAFVEAMENYVAELCPVDCVILLERCRPFNCDTSFMKYFRDQYLYPILSNLNGGPPLNADFGRDAYTSLYSLHGFYWRRPLPPATYVPDTSMIYRILKRMANLHHEERHAKDTPLGMPRVSGTSGHELLELAAQQFDIIDRARRGLCKQVQRHLILLAVSPINLDVVKQEAMHLTDPIAYPSRDGFGALESLRRRGVALSVFSPVRSTSLLKLYELVNTVASSPFHDRRWQTVALSEKLMNGDIPERRIVGPLAAEYHAQTEASLMAVAHHNYRRHHHQQGQQKQQEEYQPVIHHQQYQQHSFQPQKQMHPLQQTVNGHASNSSPTSPHVGPLSHGHPRSDLLPISSSYSLPPSGANPGTMGLNSTKPVPVNNGTHSLSPAAPCSYQTQFCATESPVLHGYRGTRITAQMGNRQASPSPVGSQQTRPVAGIRSETSRSMGDLVHSGISVPQTGLQLYDASLSGGNSGPNSVDQAPGSVYGSDSVVTPQGVSCSLLSPQQPSVHCSATHAQINQLHSPAATGNTALPTHILSQQTGPHSYNTASHSGTDLFHYGSNQSYTYKQPDGCYHPSGASQLCSTRSSSPSGLLQVMTPATTASSFRPPSNAASPAASNLMPFNAGLPSPSSGRHLAKQYSPHQQTYSGQRHLSPHSLGTLPNTPSTQLRRPHHIPSPDTIGSTNNRPRSLTPTNYIPINPAVSSSPDGAGSNGCNAHFGGSTRQVMSSGPGVSAYPQAYDPHVYRSSVPGSVYMEGPMVGSASRAPGECLTATNSVPSVFRGQMTNSGLSVSEMGHQRQDTMTSGGQQLVIGTSSQQILQRQQQLSPLDSQPAASAAHGPGRPVIWVGEAVMTDSVSSPGIYSTYTNQIRIKMRLILEQTAVQDLSHLNMQSWEHQAQLLVIHAHRGSSLVRRLSGSLSIGYILAHVLVDLPQPDEAMTLCSALTTRQPSNVSSGSNANNASSFILPLGILLPSSHGLATGAVACVCLTYNPKRNQIYGLILADSEQVRQEIATKQYMKPLSSSLTADGSSIPPLQRSYTTGAAVMHQQMGRPMSGIDDQSPLTSRMPSCVVGSNAQGFCMSQPSYGGNTHQHAISLGDASGSSLNPSHAHSYSSSGASNHNQLNAVTVGSVAGVKSMGVGMNNSSIQSSVQRNTPSPRRQREASAFGHAGMAPTPIPEPQPPPQWMSTIPPRQHQQQQQLIRTHKSNPSQQQFVQRTGNVLPHQTHHQHQFQTQQRAQTDRIPVGGSSLPGSVVIHSGLTGSESLQSLSMGSEQLVQRGSPHMSGSVRAGSMAQSQGRFTGYQTMPSMPYPTCMGNSSMVIPGMNVYAQSQPFNQRNSSYGGQQQQQPQTNQLPATNPPDTGYTMGPGCYTSMRTNNNSATTGYRVVGGSPGVGVAPGIPQQTSAQFLSKQHSQQHLQQTHPYHSHTHLDVPVGQNPNYGVVRLQHSNYDTTAPSGPSTQGFFN